MPFERQFFVTPLESARLPARWFLWRVRGKCLMAYIPEWKRGCFHRQWFPKRVLLQLPHHVYLLRGLHKKLDHLSPTRKQTFGRSMNAPSEFMGMKSIDFLSKIRPLFPYLGRNFDSAVCILEKGAETCQEHWITQSSLAANSEILNTCISASPSLTSISVFKETLLCFGKEYRTTSDYQPSLLETWNS
ncbi:hypothetical protein ACS0TY_002771 [Phlomoides rotata]